MDTREKLNEYAELRGWNKHKLIGWSEATDFGDWLVKNCSIHNVSDTLIAWEQFKKANWWESDAVDVEKVLMDKFQAFYGR